MLYLWQVHFLLKEIVRKSIAETQVLVEFIYFKLLTADGMNEVTCFYLNMTMILGIEAVSNSSSRSRSSS